MQPPKLEDYIKELGLNLPFVDTDMVIKHYMEKHPQVADWLWDCFMFGSFRHQFMRSDEGWFQHVSELVERVVKHHKHKNFASLLRQPTVVEVELCMLIACRDATLVTTIERTVQRLYWKLFSKYMPNEAQQLENDVKANGVDGVERLYGLPEKYKDDALYTDLYRQCERDALLLDSVRNRHIPSPEPYRRLIFEKLSGQYNHVALFIPAGYVVTDDITHQLNQLPPRQLTLFGD